MREREGDMSMGKENGATEDVTTYSEEGVEDEHVCCSKCKEADGGM
jgi:hypothetical protein